MVLLFFQHTFLPTSMWRPFICPGISCFQSGTFSLSWLMWLFTFGAFNRWTYWHLLILLNASTISPWKLHYLGVECLQPSLDYSGKLCLSSSGSSPSSSAQVSGRTCQWSTKTFDSGGTMLDGGPLASHSSQYVGRCSSAVSHCTRFRHGCFGRPGTTGSTVSAFNTFGSSVTDFLSLSGSGGGNLNVYVKGLHSSAGKNGLVGVLNKVYQTMPSLPLN